MVTVKARGLVIGGAVPAADLDKFLREKLKGYKPLKVRTQKLDWVRVNQLVEPSVLKILQAP